MHDPLVVNTQDGSCWRRRAVTREGRGLYGLEGTAADAPGLVLSSLADLAELGLASMADVLPVPQGPEPKALSEERLAVLRRLRTHCEAAQFESEDDRQPHVWGPSPYPKREMCQRCTVRREWAEDADATDVVLLAEVDRLRSQVAALLAERHSTNESVDDAAKALRSQRDRIAELEAAAQAARAVHVKFTTSDHCQADAERWPCPTVVALDVVSPAAPEPEPGACTECGDGPSKWCPGCAKCSCVAEHDMGCARRVGEPA